MCKLINKNIDLNSSDIESIEKLLDKLLTETSSLESNKDEQYDEGVNAIGRLIIGLHNINRIEFTILSANNKTNQL